MIVVTNRKLCRRQLHEQLELACQANPEMVILREKDLGGEELVQLASRCLDVCERHHVPLAVNSALDVARELDICRVHVSFKTMLENTPTDFSLVGVSVHSLDEAIEAEGLGADYIILGHIYHTQSKDSEPRGEGLLKQVCEAVDIPVYAIGGIDHTNYRNILACGAEGGCCMSSIMTADDPGAFIDHINNITRSV